MHKQSSGTHNGAHMLNLVYSVQYMRTYEERQMLENGVPKSTRCVNKWAMKIYSEWQGARLNQKASNEQNNSAVDTSNIQDRADSRLGR